jgi:hypothetical protein
MALAQVVLSGGGNGDFSFGIPLIALLCGAIFFGFLWWLIDKIPIKPPFHNWAQIIVATLAVIWLLNTLAWFGGHPFIVLWR